MTHPETPFDQELPPEQQESEAEATRGAEEPTHHIAGDNPEAHESEGEDTAVFGEATEAPGDTEEVYVILPDGEEGAIPVVETEVVEDGEMGELGPLAETEEATYNAFPDDGPEDYSPVPGADNLDAIASELDEEMLAADGDLAEHEGFEGVPGDFEGLPYAEGEDWGEGMEDGAPKSRRSRVGILFTVATILAIAAVGVYYVYPKWLSRDADRVALATASAPGGKALPTGAEGPGVDGSRVSPDVDQAGVGHDPTGVGVDGSGAAGSTTGLQGTDPLGGDPGDPVLLAKKEFHNRFLSAIEIGFVGEVGDE
jgi:hypothetical protein